MKILISKTGSTGRRYGYFFWLFLLAIISITVASLDGPVYFYSVIHFQGISFVCKFKSYYIVSFWLLKVETIKEKKHFRKWNPHEEKTLSRITFLDEFIIPTSECKSIFLKSLPLTSLISRIWELLPKFKTLQCLKFIMMRLRHKPLQKDPNDVDEMKIMFDFLQKRPTKCFPKQLRKLRGRYDTEVLAYFITAIIMAPASTLAPNKRQSHYFGVKSTKRSLHSFFASQESQPSNDF